MDKEKAVRAAKIQSGGTKTGRVQDAVKQFAQPKLSTLGWIDHKNLAFPETNACNELLHAIQWPLTTRRGSLAPKRFSKHEETDSRYSHHAITTTLRSSKLDSWDGALVESGQRMSHQGRVGSKSRRFPGVGEVDDDVFLTLLLTRT